MNNKKRFNRKLKIILDLILIVIYIVGIRYGLVSKNYGMVVILCFILIFTVYSLYHDRSSKIGESTPTSDDLQKLDKELEKPHTEEEIKINSYRELAKNHPFSHPIYGNIDVDIDMYFIQGDYTHSDVLLKNKKTGFELEIGVGKEINLNEFLQNDEIKKRILNKYAAFIKENGEKLRKYLIDTEYQQAWDWVSGLDNEDNIYYTGNKTKEEFKKVMENNFELKSHRINIDAYYNIDSIMLWSEIDKIYVQLIAKIKNGKVDYNSIMIDFDY